MDSPLLSKLQSHPWMVEPPNRLPYWESRIPTTLVVQRFVPLYASITDHGISRRQNSECIVIWCLVVWVKHVIQVEDLRVYPHYSPSKAQHHDEKSLQTIPRVSIIASRHSNHYCFAPYIRLYHPFILSMGWSPANSCGPTYAATGPIKHTIPRDKPKIVNLLHLATRHIHFASKQTLC